MTRPRVLLIAEAANPEWTSVPLVGWSHAKALRALCDAHVVTQVRNREAIERAGWRHGVDFTAIDSEAVARRIYRAANFLRGGADRGWTTLTALNTLSYYYFERLVWKAFGARIHDGEFDIVHRLTPLSPAIPSLLAAKCASAGVPFILGPINGGVPWPKGFDDVRRSEREGLSKLRGAYRFLPGYAGTRRYAAAILVASRITWDQIPAKYRKKCIYLPENGVDVSRFLRRTTFTPHHPLRALFVGRIVPLKGLDMLIDAAAPLIGDGKLELEIVGDGPELDALKRRAADQKISDGIVFTGWIAHEDLRAHFSAADVFTFPSIREFGGGAVLEAMAMGVPPIVVDYAGPGELVTDSTGFKVPLGSREAIVRVLRQHLEASAAAPEVLAAKSVACRERVERWFTWEAKAAQVACVYAWVLGESVEKPDFGMPFSD